MNVPDYSYIAENISNLSRIPVRVYRSGELVCTYGTSDFPKDPVSLYLREFLDLPKNVSYFITPYYQYYGIIRQDAHCMIIGPTYQIPPGRAQIREFMFLLGIQEHYLEHYQALQNSVTPMPFELFLHLICMVHYFLTQEKLSVAELMLYDSSGGLSFRDLPEVTSPAKPSDAVPDLSPPHDTMAFEETMLSYIQNGEPDRLKELFAHTSAGQAGKMASTYLRQLKDMFIVTVTLASRAAIRGGLPPEEALSLSDRCILHCEKFESPEQIMNLQYHMILDYATLVSELSRAGRSSKFMRTAAAYIREHLSDGITVEQMARDLYMSRSHLSARFKKENGASISAYIRQQKIKKAQEYLKNTDRTLLEISTYLGFSSQGYFQNVFKKATGMTPTEYRES